MEDNKKSHRKVGVLHPEGVSGAPEEGLDRGTQAGAVRPMIEIVEKKRGFWACMWLVVLSIVLAAYFLAANLALGVVAAQVFKNPALDQRFSTVQANESLLAEGHKSQQAAIDKILSEIELYRNELKKKAKRHWYFLWLA